MDAAQIAAMITDREDGTPGPWLVDGPVWNQTVWTDHENRLCFMAHSNGLNDDRDKANARRIARVPDMEATIIAQAAELERLRAALEFYADKDGWTQPPVKTREGLISVEYENQASKIQRDRGKVAREALKGGTQ